jgi:hypothetical protein
LSHAEAPSNEERSLTARRRSLELAIATLKSWADARIDPAACDQPAVRPPSPAAVEPTAA